MSPSTSGQEPPSTNSASTTGPLFVELADVEDLRPALAARRDASRPRPRRRAWRRRRRRRGCPSASGTANGGTRRPGARPLTPFGFVVIVLIVISTRITIASSADVAAVARRRAPAGRDRRARGTSGEPVASVRALRPGHDPSRPGARAEPRLSAPRRRRRRGRARRAALGEHERRRQRDEHAEQRHGQVDQRDEAEVAQHPDVRQRRARRSRRSPSRPRRRPRRPVRAVGRAAAPRSCRGRQRAPGGGARRAAR